MQEGGSFRPKPLRHIADNVKSLWYFLADLDADEWGRKEGKKTDGPYYLLQRGEGERRVC